MSRYIGKKDNEVFVGNYRIPDGKIVPPDYLHLLKTVRLGDQALDLNGHFIDANHYRPIFIDCSEAGLYDKIMMHRTYPDSPRWKM